MSKRSEALREVTGIYFLTALIGIGGYLILAGEQIQRFLQADLAMTLLIFAVSLWRKNSSSYDAFWSVIPFYFIAGFFTLNKGPMWDWSQWGAALMVSLWSWRLTLNWARSWPGWEHEDWRYVMFRQQLGRHFQWMNFFGIHLYPTLIVFLSCLGLFWIYEPSKQVIWMHLLGLTIGFLGIGFEYIADNELVRFRTTPGRTQADVLNTGIWSYCRNPNYLGEMLFWFGLALCGFAAGGPWYVGLGSIGMLLLFLFASIPMKEKRMLERRPAFQTYQEDVPMLIPIPGKSRS
jgi:steroid 5-alpha reductase family enzyme